MNATVFVIATSLATCFGALLFSVITLHFYRLYDRSYLLFWAKSWVAFGIYLLGGVTAVSIGPMLPAAHPVRLLSAFLSMAAVYLHVVWLFFGTYELSTDKKIAPALAKKFLVGVCVLAVVVTLAFAFTPQMSAARYFARIGLKNLLAGLTFLIGGLLLYRRWKANKSMGRLLVSLAFIVYGINLLVQFVPALLYLFDVGLSISYVLFFVLFDFLLLFVTGLGLVTWLFDEEHERVVRTTETLRESEEIMRSIHESVPDIILKVDLDGTIRFINRTLSNIPAETIVGTSVFDHVAPEMKPIMQTSYEYVIKTGRTDQYEFTYKTREDKQLCFESRVGPVMRDGTVVALTIITTDITERKQVTADRERLIEKLEAKNTELERFTYTVSHDLKAPMVTIKGFLGLLGQDVEAGDIEHVQRDITHITEATNKMQRLLNELLELSRIGRLMNAPEPVALNDLIHDAVQLVCGRLANANVSIKIAPDLPVVVCDRVRLLQVFQNLIDNAVKFMGAQPAPCIEVGAGQDEGAVCCYVRDNGIGIDPKFHEKIFGLFERLSIGYEGTGIGLALARRIVEVHGGHIWVESNGPGCGSTFYFTLPNEPHRSSQEDP